MAFRLFTEFGAASRDEATIRARGGIFLSYAITKRAGIGKPESARLYFDEDSDRIGIEMLDSGDSNDKSQRKVSKEKSGVAVNAAALFRYYGFELGKKRSAPVELDGNLIVIDVSEMPRKDLGSTGEEEDINS